MVEEENQNPKLSSDLHTCIMACAHRQTDKYNKDVRLSGKGWGLREGVGMEHRVLRVVGT